MTIDVNYVLERLSIRQIESGGYYGFEYLSRREDLREGSTVEIISPQLVQLT